MDLPTPVSRPDPGSADWVPVDACTLPTSDRPLRLAEFDDLFATSLTAVERPAGGPGTRARLVLSGGAGLRERVQRLADAETACCSFFTFTVAPLPGADGGAAVTLDVEVPAPHAAVLAALVARAERVRRAAA